MIFERKSIFYLELLFLILTFLFSFFFLLNSISDIKKKNLEIDETIKKEAPNFVAILKNINLSSHYNSFPYYSGKESKLNVVAAGWFLGNKQLCVFPEKFEFPSFKEPPKGFDGIETVGFLRRMYVFKVEDGRVCAILFELKEFKKDLMKTILISLTTLLIGLFALYLIFVTFKQLKNYNEPQRRDFSKEEITPFETIDVFKKTIGDLKEKTIQLEVALNQEKKKSKSTASVLENLSSGLNTGFMRFDKEGNLQSFNAIAKNLFGLPILFRIGENYKKLFSKNETLLEIIDASLKEKEILTGESIKGFQGKLLFVLSIPILDGLSHLDGVLLIIQDNSKIYEMQRIIKERESLSRIGEVAAVVAHEIRNGLNVLSGELRLLKKVSGPDALERANRIDDEISKMETVVKDLLYYSKPLAIEKETIDTEEFLNEVIISLKEIFPDVNFSYKIDLKSFYGDRNSIFRAIFNLLKNSAEVSSEILVEVFERDGKVIFHIEDNGAGLSEEAKQTLFTPFISQKKGGTGLGIPIAKKIATEHNGDLEIATPKKLKGASFNFIIESKGG
jgi:signal transduction histidine kinase